MTQQTNLQALCAEQLPELRGMFERILCVARSSDGPTVGHIQLADQLIDAVVSWSENSLAQPEPEGVTDEEWCVLKMRLWEQYETVGYQGERFMYDADFYTALDVARQEITRYARPTIEAVPVAERPILKSSDFNDANGHCWCGTRASVDETGDLPVEMPPSWELREPCAQDDCVLPHHALPIPAF